MPSSPGGPSSLRARLPAFRSRPVQVPSAFRRGGLKTLWGVARPLLGVGSGWAPVVPGIRTPVRPGSLGLRPPRAVAPEAAAGGGNPPGRLRGPSLRSPARAGCVDPVFNLSGPLAVLSLWILSRRRGPRHPCRPPLFEGRLRGWRRVRQFS